MTSFFPALPAKVGRGQNMPSSKLLLEPDEDVTKLLPALCDQEAASHQSSVSHKINEIRMIS